MDGSAAGFRLHFVVGGAQKGGTSALAHFLAQHPEICFSKHKEPHFFDRPDFPEGTDAEDLNRRYLKAFPRDWAGKVVGEGTPISMYLPGVAERIRAYHPATKWVLLLRHPVERAVSHYSMERGRGAEWLPLPWALRAERWRGWRDRGWLGWQSSVRTHSYLDRGRYSGQIERLWRLFGREQVLVLTSDALGQQHAETLRQVYQFLGLRDQTFIPAAESVFVTGEKAAVAAPTRAWMLRQLAGEVDRLEAMLDVSLEAWRH